MGRRKRTWENAVAQLTSDFPVPVDPRMTSSGSRGALLMWAAAAEAMAAAWRRMRAGPSRGRIRRQMESILSEPWLGRGSRRSVAVRRCHRQLQCRFESQDFQSPFSLFFCDGRKGIHPQKKGVVDLGFSGPLAALFSLPTFITRSHPPKKNNNNNRYKQLRIRRYLKIPAVHVGFPSFVFSPSPHIRIPSCTLCCPPRPLLLRPAAVIEIISKPKPKPLPNQPK